MEAEPAGIFPLDDFKYTIIEAFFYEYRVDLRL